MTVIILFIILHWYLSLFFQTFFLHRYAAHGAFKMSKGMEKAFFVLTWIFQGSNYLSAYSYGIMHRLHHAYADTEKDPHSPKYDDNLFKMMWRTKEIYSNILAGDLKVEERFTKNVPEWKSFDIFASSWGSRLAWGVLYTLVYIVFAPHWLFFFLLPVHYLMSPIHGVIINWFAHKYGYRNFEVGDTSRNLLPLDFLMLGESYHNNHHKHGGRANFGFRWFEIDPIYYVILFFSKLGIIQYSTK